MAYKACLLLIQSGNMDGLADKLDLFLAFGRISTEQYGELMEMLAEKEVT